MRKIANAVVVAFILFPGSGCFRGGDDQTGREIAVSRLEEGLGSDYFWVRVHAREFLAQLHPGTQTDTSFRTFLKQHEAIPGERIGVWRVGAMTGPEHDKGYFLDKIKEAYLDTAGTDRLHAAESLAKLGVAIKNMPGGVIQSDIDSGGKMRGYILWGLSLPATQDAAPDYKMLLDEFKKGDAGTCESIAYALTKLPARMPAEVWKEVRELATDNRWAGFVRNRLKLALFLNSENPDQRDALKKEVVDFLQNEDKRLQYAACEALAAKGDRHDIAALAKMVTDEQPVGPGSEADPGLVKAHADVRIAAAFALLSLDKQTPRSPSGLSGLDWAVIVLFLVWMIGIGFFYSIKSKNSDDYFLGGRSMNPIMVGLSLFATLLSTLSYLAYPGEMIKYGPMMFFGILAYPIAYFLIARFIIPRIMELNVTSAYEILELKLGAKVRDLGTVFFLLLRFLWMATIIYATINTALIHILGFSQDFVPWACLLLSLITVLYTTMGGMKAVVLTDVIQSVIMFAGAVFTIVVISFDFGSLTEWFPKKWLPHWQEITWKVDLNQRMTVGNIIMMALLWKVCTSGSDQMAIQRYLSTRDIASAKQSLKTSLWSSAVLQIILAVLGLALASFFLKHPESLGPGTSVYENADTLFPRFILIGLPAGMTGLVVAALMSAAMSSLSSGLNSSSSVIYEDIWIRYFPGFMKHMHPLRKVHWISAIMGVTVSVCSMFVGHIEGNLLDVVNKVVNLVVAPLFVLFFMALFVPGATETGTFWGGLFSLLIAVLIAFFDFLNLGVLMILPVSLVSGIIMSTLLSFLSRIRT